MIEQEDLALQLKRLKRQSADQVKRLERQLAERARQCDLAWRQAARQQLQLDEAREQIGRLVVERDEAVHQVEALRRQEEKEKHHSENFNEEYGDEITQAIAHVIAGSIAETVKHLKGRVEQMKPRHVIAFDVKSKPRVLRYKEIPDGNGGCRKRILSILEDYRRIRRVGLLILLSGLERDVSCIFGWSAEEGSIVGEAVTHAG